MVAIPYNFKDKNMRAEMRRYNVKLIPDENEDKSKLVNYLWRILARKATPGPVMYNTGEYNSKGKPVYENVGMATSVSLYTIPTTSGFLLPIGLFYSLRKSIEHAIGSEITLDESPHLSATDESREISVSTSPGWAPRKHQLKVLEFLDKKTALPNKLVGLPTGTGKEQPNHLVTPTPQGWRLWGDLKVGDELFGSDGQPTKILARYPQGVTPYFHVEFSDGTTTECGAEHLWEVHDVRSENKRVMSLEKIVEEGKENFNIPSNTKPVVYDHHRPRSMGSLVRTCALFQAGDIKILPVWITSGSVATREYVYAHFMRNEEYSHQTFPAMVTIALLGLGRSLGKTLKHRSFNRKSGMVYRILETPNSPKTFKSVLYIGETEQTCVRVSADDSLYMTSDFIITHNTCCVFFRMAHIQKVTAIVLRPFLTQQWKREAQRVLSLSEDDILVVSGKKTMMTLLEDARNGACTHKLYIISNKTYVLYMKEFFNSTVLLRDDALKRHDKNLGSRDNAKEAALRARDRDLYDQYMMKKNREAEEKEKTGYIERYPDVPPGKFFKKLGVGCVVVDEAHLDPHMNNFLYATLGNVEQQISLSATYFSSVDFLKGIFGWTFANYNNYDELKSKRYIRHMTYTYSHMYIESWQYTQGPMYSHNKYESKYLIRKGKVIPKYLKMVDDITNAHYVIKRKENSRCLIFFQSLVMVGEFHKYFSDKYPELKVVKYTGAEKSDADLATSDIIIATVGKAAVGLDLKDLITVINCISIKSAPLNVQILGRLRELPVEKYGDSYETFIQLECDSIHPHRGHHYERLPYIKARTAVMDNEKYPGVI